MLKDKKITIYRLSTVKDNCGGETSQYTAYTTNIWAYYRQLSTKEIDSSFTGGFTENNLFCVNYRSDLQKEDVIKFKSKYYEITRIDNYEGYKDDIKIYVKEINKPKIL